MKKENRDNSTKISHRSRPIKDIVLNIEFDPEVLVIRPGTIKLQAGLTVTLTGDSEIDMIADMKQHMSIDEKLQGAILDGCADAFALIFGTQVLDDHTTH